MKRMAGAVMAEFPDYEALQVAAAAIDELGFRSVETYSPILDLAPVVTIAAAMGAGISWLGDGRHVASLRENV